MTQIDLERLAELLSPDLDGDLPGLWEKFA
jgi:hypothetical protein